MNKTLADLESIRHSLREEMPEYTPREQQLATSIICLANVIDNLVHELEAFTNNGQSE